MAKETKKEPTSTGIDEGSGVPVVDTHQSSCDDSTTVQDILSIDNDSQQDKLKGRHFWYVVYPESAPEDWREQLQMTGLSACVSPLHDKDVNPDGAKKKAHYHVIVSWANTTTYKNARQLGERIFKGPRPKLLADPKGAYRYHHHKDNPEKFQYTEPNEIINGWQVPLDSEDVAKIKKQILALVLAEDITEYAELLVECSGMEPEFLEVATNNTLYCNAICTSYRNNPVKTLKRYYNTLEEGELKETIYERIKNYQEVQSHESKNK